MPFRLMVTCAQTLQGTEEIEIEMDLLPRSVVNELYNFVFGQLAHSKPSCDGMAAGSSGA